jgi:hypothetical protein
VIADRRLCLSKEGKLVEAGAVDSAFLLAGKGQVIAASRVKELNLIVMDGRVEQWTPQKLEAPASPETFDEVALPEPAVVEEYKPVAPKRQWRKKQ